MRYIGFEDISQEPCQEIDWRAMPCVLDLTNLFRCPMAVSINSRPLQEAVV
ncbi:MAG: hypothetical protein MRQ08_02450 [Candidatus Midichloria mitochondrii]|nr:hypothetical protein [Candidatus Midichloria mitochondrii]MDJ1288092.1 hypothetical protein [Candidatus Midichloria mitochondrii]